VTPSAQPLDIQPVILCGGSGTRLWPLSRTGFPKQFLCLTGRDSLFQQAARRLAGLADCDLAVAAPLIVSNEEHRFLALEQLRETGIALGAALLEPVGRNTAPALTLAALAGREGGRDPILVVTPADQTVADGAAFTAALRQAVHAAAGGDIVILGIAPDRAETGYGYIKVGPLHPGPLAVGAREHSDSHRGEASEQTIPFPHPLSGASSEPTSPLPAGKVDLPLPAGERAGVRGNTLHTVERFVEKPDAATAQGYLETGGYYWNAGIFVLRASTWLAALAHFRPDIAAATRGAWAARTLDTSTSANFVRPGAAEFAAIPADSVDYAVMERCPGGPFAIRMVPLSAGWNDLGAWDAVWQALPKDTDGNAHTGDVLTSDSRNTLVHAASRLVSLVGVDDLIVVETADAVLVADRARSQEVKAIVAQLQADGRGELALHRKVHRPWGWYDSIDEGSRFKVKRIQVKPKASLSLQKHHHRAEHWIVVKGTAEITCGDKTLLLTENQSTYIPLGETHRLANPGTIPLEIIEVQSGSYLGEDDIVRFDDHYGRDRT
jgi:mannose-1-phosphate guanylyltransferase/mannose-6-phosphate isomerase